MISEHEQKSPFEHFEQKGIKRRQLLTGWMKFFCWVFMIFGALAILCLFLGFTNLSVDLSFYGIQTNTPFSIAGLSVISIAILKGVASYLLWFEKDAAINVGIVDAILGIVICIFVMIFLPSISENYHFSLRLEIAFLVPYLIRLTRIEKQWKNSF